MTTFKQAGDILNDLGGQGVNGLFSRYKGWQSGGATDGTPVIGYNPAGSLGGGNGMVKLKETAESLGGVLYLTADILNVATDAHPLESLNALKRVTGRTVELYGGRWKLLTPERTVEASAALAGIFAKNGMRADIGEITSFLSSYTEDGAYYDRADNAALYSQAVSGFDAPALTKPFAYLWKYAAALTEMPSGGSDYMFVWREVPFLSIAMSGKIPVYFEYTNFQPNQREFFLKLIETGARPSFLVTAADSSLLRETSSNEIYSSRYDLYREQIIECDNELKAFHNDYINGAEITGHSAEHNLTVVEYGNGTTVYINYGDSPVAYAGGTLGAMDYAVTKGGGGI
jgi:hypothetical protein